MMMLLLAAYIAADVTRRSLTDLGKPHWLDTSPLALQFALEARHDPDNYHASDRSPRLGAEFFAAERLIAADEYFRARRGFDAETRVGGFISIAKVF